MPRQVCLVLAEPPAAAQLAQRGQSGLGPQLVVGAHRARETHDRLRVHERSLPTHRPRGQAVTDNSGLEGHTSQTIHAYVFCF